jgi:hypothetical protein
MFCSHRLPFYFWENKLIYLPLAYVIAHTSTIAYIRKPNWWKFEAGMWCVLKPYHACVMLHNLVTHKCGMPLSLELNNHFIPSVLHSYGSFPLLLIIGLLINVGCLCMLELNNHFPIWTTVWWQFPLLLAYDLYLYTFKNRENMKEEQLWWAEGILLSLHSVSQILSVINCQVLMVWYGLLS